ncbi:hypothetical protein [Aureimonas sp. N4]|uniref:hypothetical protein n=1 Tax=Aureimonas sp. N4 TaxID=1638165 RepID=UPI000780B606|nr:hypothetical protein [Aureimonas sp. N4]
MTALSDLSSIQIRALIKLDTPGGVEDSVGREIGELSDPMLAGVFGLIALGLATSEIGWRNTAWFRLTAKGRAVREMGEA